MTCAFRTVYSQDSAATRYDIISTADDRHLYYDGELAFPAIRGNNSLSILASFPFDHEDVVIVRDNGGTICPAEYYLIRLDAANLKAVGPLGTCSETIFLTPDFGDLIIETPAFGDVESRAYRYRPSEHKVTALGDE